MFESFSSFVAEFVDGERHPSQFADNDYRLAAMALLMHAAAIDGEMSPSERDKLRAVVKRRFDLDDAAAGELIDKATLTEHEAVDLYHFTSLLNRALDEPGRARVIEMMWEIVYADGRRDSRRQSVVARRRSARRIAARAHRAAPAHRRAGRSRRRMRPVTLITGASAGIGAELARVFAEHGHELVLVARREHRLLELAEEIAAAGRPRPTVLSVDLERPGAASLLGAELAARDLEPANVVNNAGFGLVGQAATMNTSPSRTSLECYASNPRSLLRNTRAALSSPK
jgi:uncharacterized tellurite resistance protein B-like protein